MSRGFILVAPEPIARPGPFDRLGFFAAVVAGIVLLALAIRPQATEDLGYHLAYGDALWRGEGIVSDSRWVNPPVTADEIAAGLPPGAWVDEGGSYRFPNANWLTQAVMSLVYGAAGGVGLTLLGVMLVAAIGAAQAGLMRRLELGWGSTAVVWLLTGIIGFERFTVRPELFGFACMAGQMWLLVGTVTARRVVAAVALQVLAVNLHSYWVLGAAVAMALAGEALVKLVWNHVIPRRPDRPHMRWVIRQAMLMTLAAAAMLLAGFVHPFTWRAFALPFQTLSYLNEHHIAGAELHQAIRLWGAGGGHPWMLVGEFQWPFQDITAGLRSTVGFSGLMLLSLPAMGLMLLYRKPGWILLTLMMIGAGCTMRRNLAPAVIVMAPLVVGALAMSAKPQAAWRRLAGGFIAAVTAVASLIALPLIVSSTWYTAEGWPWRFGAGMDRTALTLDLCQWLDDNLPDDEPVFTTYQLSSNLVHFSRRVTGACLLSNTWAYPPVRLEHVIATTTTASDLDPWARQAGVDLVVLGSDTLTDNLTQYLAASSQWALIWTQDDVRVFLRRTPAHAALIQRTGVKEAPRLRLPNVNP